MENKKIHNRIVDPEALLRKIEEEDAIIQAVMDGQERACPVCGSILQFVPPGSSTHPGIYCGKGCTEILLSMRVR